MFDFVAPKVKVPVNLFLRIEQPKQDLASGHLRAALELRTDTDADSVRVDNRDLPLEYEPTAALAYQLSESTVWQRELWGFSWGICCRSRKQQTWWRAHRTGRGVFRWSSSMGRRRVRDVGLTW